MRDQSEPPRTASQPQYVQRHDQEYRSEHHGRHDEHRAHDEEREHGHGYERAMENAERSQFWEISLILTRARCLAP